MTPLTRTELVMKPVLTMSEAAIVARKSVQALRRFVEDNASREPALIDRSGGHRRIKTASLLRILDETCEGILERERLVEVVNRYGERLNDHAVTLREHDGQIRAIDTRLRRVETARPPERTSA